jgi:hypothetical protein
MAVNLLHPRKTFLPKVPADIEDKELREYLSRLTDALENMYTKLVDNDDIVVSMVNTGTSGSFDDSAGGTVTVVKGIITGLA